MRQPRILTIILAGGSGGRLGSLTENRAKPAMPVGGSYRLIDVPLSNLHNSGLSDVWIVEQFEPKSLNDHLVSGRPWDLDRTNGGLRVLPPYQGSDGEGFAQGNADALYRQADYIREYDPDLLLVLSADHLYRLDYRDVIATHLESEAALTAVTYRITNNPSDHGVVQTADGRVTGFEYKPENPATNLITAEIFLYDAPTLLASLEELVERDGRLDDYGDQLLPYFVQNMTVAEYRLEGYWRDMGTPASYHQAHMDLLDGHGLVFDDPAWPILSATPRRLPAFVGTAAQVETSLLAPGCRVEGRITRSVIGPDCQIEAGAEVHGCVLLDGVRVSSGARLRNMIVDSGAVIGGVTDLDGAAEDPETGSAVVTAAGALEKPPA